MWRVSRQELNLGILAHVDAGKTTLTERLLYNAGVIAEPGSVDAGTTQTDSLALERRRGITIKSAVASFNVGDVHVNLIDTPGHPDFIAEVERVLSVLDGAVLVISAVEGVQPQTRILWRALHRLQVPTLMFVNKTDRRGADVDRVVRQIAERLTPAVVRMPLDDSAVPVLAERDEDLLAAYVDGEMISSTRLHAALAEQTGRAAVHPVFSGSALTGIDVDPLRAGIAQLLPPARGDVEGRASATVFKVERGPGGEKVAYARMFAGALHVRETVPFGAELEGKVTGIAVFDNGAVERRQDAHAGEIAKVWGLHEIRIGDAIGVPHGMAERQFAPPTLEGVVVP